MRVNVRIDRGKLNGLSIAAKKAIVETAEQLRTEIILSRVIPFDEGTLQNVQTNIDIKALSNGQIKFIHDTPYAARLYYNPQYDFDKTINSNAKGEWWEEYLTGPKSGRPAELFSQFYNRSIGG